MKSSNHIQKLLSGLILSTTLLSSVTCYAADKYAFTVSKETDLQLSCEQLVDEAALMRDIMQTTEDIKTESSVNGHAVSAVGALGSFLVGTVTGGLSLAAAGFIASREVEQDGDNAESVQDIAGQRRALMNGIYKAKDCEKGGMTAAMTPIKTKSVLAASAERLAAMEPAGGKEKNGKPKFHQND